MKRCLLYIAIFIILFAIFYKPLIGISVLITLMLTIFVKGVITAYFNKDKEADLKGKTKIKQLSNEELDYVQKLFRYATAVLAFLSLVTTANGMKNFVFNNSWLAYMGSFAVQAILVGFSLLLCHIFVKITTLFWYLYVKKITMYFLIVFFNITLVLSSTFSFSYIANYAYKDSWTNDSESIIREFLSEKIFELYRENENRGDIILKSINTIAKENLLGVMDANREQNKEELHKELLIKINELNVSFNILDESLVDIDKDILINSYPEYLNDIEQLCQNYDLTYRNVFVNAVTEHNKIKNLIAQWENSLPDYVDMLSQIKAWNANIDSLQQNLDSANRNIENWKTSRLINDISMYRATFKTEALSLKGELNKMQKKLNEIRKIVEEIEEIENGSSMEKELNDLLAQIYLLGVDETIKVEDLIEIINNLAITASNNPSFDSEDIQSVISIKDKLNLYNDYLRLKEKLDHDAKPNFKKIYQINNDDIVKKNENDLEEQSLIVVISEEKWKECRNTDFDSLYSYVQELPDLSEEENVFVIKMMDEASTIQRDLLGNITEFERAFIYFKYKFPIMAIFSAYIAVFFDLGAFFIGCFLYVTKYFDDEDEQQEDKDKS